MIKEQILSVLGYSTYTEIQERFLETANKHAYLQLLAPTGSGKTIAFLVFILERLQATEKGVQALILVPGRELALQIEAVFKQFKSGYKIVSCYGGHDFKKESQQLVESPAIIVGTPGRIAQHLELGNFDPREVRLLVIDEFDKALEQGFDEDMGFIVSNLESYSHSVLTSATLLEEAAPYLDLHKYHVLDFRHIKSNAAGRNFYKVQLSNLDRLSTLDLLLGSFNFEPTLVFCKTRSEVDEIYQILKQQGLAVERYHGALEQRDREIALFKFDNGTASVLVCTDLAARGLDLSAVKHIVHFDEPLDEASFVHRNGRAGRLQQEQGSVYVFYSSDDDLLKYNTDFLSFNLETASKVEVEANSELVAKEAWLTLYISLGKKDKIQKGDILGFFVKEMNLDFKDIGKILIKDKVSFFALKESKLNMLLQNVRDRKLKNKKFKLEVAN